MSSQKTRDRLISIIKDHQLKHGQTKLAISQLADTAGISRQAFNRYYGDLKDYSIGKEPIARLLVDDNASLSELIENKDERIIKLEDELKALKSAHKAELERVVDSYLSTLMNNDILAFEAGQISATLTNQGNHNAYLNNLVTELKVKNAKLTMDIASANSDISNISEKSEKNFISFDLNLDAAIKLYTATKKISDYEDHKDEKLLEIVQRINKLPNPEHIDTLLFQEKYISDFQQFCKRTFPSKNRLLIVIRLPLYSQEEIKLFIRSLRPISSFSIYVPYSASEAIISAKRQFSFRDTPPEELAYADNAKLPLMSWGFDSIYVTKIKQGD
jgi:AcrR family transcriptional regulator